MASPWAAWPSGTDPVELSRVVALAREQFLTEGSLNGSIRPIVAASWQRSLAGGLDPDGTLAPVDVTDDELEEYRNAHPLASAMPIVRQLLVEDAADTGLVVAVSDASGRLLWVEGARSLRSRAEHMHFVEGARWAETDAGTSAPGLALALDHAVQVFAAEHLASPVTPWSCAAAPVHAPDGHLLGVIDVTGGDDVARPHSLALVRAAAAAVEGELRLHVSHPAPTRAVIMGHPRIRPTRQSRSPMITATLRALGERSGSLSTPRETTSLRLRHAEMLLILAEHPRGLSVEQLALELHEQDVAPVTLRAEVSRLRELLGGLGVGRLTSRPYRLEASPETLSLTTDVDDVRRLLARGAHRRALAAYPGPVLAMSAAPGVVRIRESLARDVRSALIAAGDAESLWTLARRPESVDDDELWRSCLKALPRSSPRRPLVIGHLRHLETELG